MIKIVHIQIAYVKYRLIKLKMRLKSRRLILVKIILPNFLSHWTCIEKAYLKWFKNLSLEAINITPHLIFQYLNETRFWMQLQIDRRLLQRQWLIVYVASQGPKMAVCFFRFIFLPGSGFQKIIALSSGHNKTYCPTK